MLRPAIQGTQNILDAAKLEPGIEHMVITSSAAAMLDFSKMPRVDWTYGAKDWNPTSMLSPRIIGLGTDALVCL